MVSKIIKQVLLYALAVLLLIFTGVPFLAMVNSSFKDQLEFMQSPWSLPDAITLENYAYLLETDFITYFGNSVFVVTISVIITIFLSAMAAYPLARLNFKLNTPIFVLFLVGMMIPIHTTLVPIFQLTVGMGLYDTLWALIGPYVAFALPVSIVIFRQFLRELPKELEESAQIDGCGHFMLFWKILFPLLTPAIATITIYNFIIMWNEFIFALVLTNSPGNATLPLGLRDFQGDFSVNVPGMMAALTLASVPLLLIYFFAQEKIVKGIAAGSVKG
ncbi:carbohydrate ABC transporter permease [Alkalicoccus chagannorensis]|uniref:carbohydrate ABC transporter permease n=1 Tax=Alkalicoccus chagannorensis TaxID=427072 RepID=UPI00040E04A9|nr:carbohydrate ABC transporter permease [Alkalicoccus chagannorensis]